MSEQIIKIFAINDCDWWAGYDLESCIVAAMSETGMARDELLGWGEAHELTDEEMDTLKFVDDDGQQSTFREHLELSFRRDGAVPYFFASTEC